MSPGPGIRSYTGKPVGVGIATCDMMRPVVSRLQRFLESGELVIYLHLGLVALTTFLPFDEVSGRKLGRSRRRLLNRSTDQYQ